MNIFHLDKNPKICAEYHCDRHVVKMILETAQMLSTAISEHSMGIAQDRLYNNLQYYYNSGKITKDQVRFGISRLELKI